MVSKSAGEHVPVRFFFVYYSFLVPPIAPELSTQSRFRCLIRQVFYRDHRAHFRDETRPNPPWASVSVVPNPEPISAASTASRAAPPAASAAGTEVPAAGTGYTAGAGAAAIRVGAATKRGERLHSVIDYIYSNQFTDRFIIIPCVPEMEPYCS